MSNRPPLTYREPSLGGQHTADASGQPPRLGGDAALTHAIQALGDPDWQVRNRAVEMLEQIGGKRVLDLLLRALDDENWAVQRRATAALGTVGGEQAFQALLAALRLPSPFVQAGAAEALGRLGDTRAVDPLVEVMLRDLRLQGDAVAARQAARALGMIGDLQAIAPLVEMSFFRGGRRREEEYDWALRQLYEHYPQQVTDYLLENLYLPRWNPVGLAPLIGRVKPSNAVPRLIDILSHPNQTTDTQQITIWALGHLQDDRALSTLKNIIFDTRYNYYVRRDAMRAVERIDSLNASHVLIEIVASNIRMSHWAARSLTYARDRHALPSLIALLDHPEWRVRKLAAYVLGRRHIRRAIPALLTTLQDNRGRVRAEAALALGRIKDVEAISMLAICLEDAVQPVRRRAAQALVRIHGRYPEAFGEHMEALRTAQEILE